MGPSAGLLQRCLAAWECTGAQRWHERWQSQLSAAAAMVAVALGTGTLSGSNGLGRLPSPPGGCAGLPCRARSRAVPYRVGRGHTDRFLAYGRGPPFAGPCSVYLSFPVCFFSNLSF